MKPLARTAHLFGRAALALGMLGVLAAAALAAFGREIDEPPETPPLLPAPMGWVVAALALATLAWAARSLMARAGRAQAADAAQADGRTLRLLKDIAESSPDPMFAKDLAGRYLLINRAAATLLGADAARVLGHSAQEMFAPALAERIEDLERRIVERGEPESFEETIDTPQGRQVFLTTKGPLRDADGRVTGVYSLSRDITLVRRHEEELHHLQMAVEQSSESIVITDLEAQIVYANAAAQAVTGYTREELMGRNCRLLQSGKTPRATYTELWAALRNGRSWRGLLFNRRKDGSDYVEEAVITPVRMPHGRVTHYLAVKKDVTEQQRMAAELERYHANLEELVAQRTAELDQARRAAESANEAKSAFLATMSHEIRTPMNGVVGLAEVLAQSNLTPYQADLVRTMRESSFGLLSLIDELLDFSKIEAGRLELERTPLALRALVESACDVLQPGAAARGVMLHVFVDPALPEQVLLDGVRWRQILNNLAGNAIKFSAGLERTGRVRVRVAGEGDTLLLTVADNGIGMTAATLARIFQPFTQAESSTTRRYGGTGLGLSIVQRLVHAFGGNVEVLSTPGEGTSFTVRLPLVAVTDGAAAAPEADACDRRHVCCDACDLRGLRCLVCADDAELGADWAAYLAAAGAEVGHWTDPQAVRAALMALGPEAGGGRVAVVGVDWPAGLADELRQAAQLGGSGLVLIGRGQRRSPRRGRGGEIGLDGDAMHRTALVGAVALAAGRLGCPSTRADAGAPVFPAAAGALLQPAAAGAAEPGAEALAPLLSSAAGLRVLVAEDNPINQEVIRRQLALLGVAADVAADGEIALAHARSGDYALLLTDLHMPGLDGYELTRRIRAEAGALQRLPVIALTATALYGEAERCRAAGMDDYLSKPLTLERLAAALRRWLPEPPALAAPLHAGDDEGSGAGASPEPGAATGLTLPVMDTGVLTRLVGDDPAVLGNIRNAFVHSARRAGDEMRAALFDERFEAAMALAHRLKGAAAAVGALALADLCSRIERAAAAADAGALAAAGQGFDEALAAVLRRLEPGALPQAPAAEPAPASTSAPAPAPAASLIVVDDDPFQLEVLRSQLAALVQLPVLAMPSGAAALAAVGEGETAQMMLLVDLGMPGMDGIELMRRLAAGGYGGALALMSAAGERVLESGARLAAEHKLRLVGHVHKPVSPDALRALVQRWREHMPAPARAAARRYGAAELERALAQHQLVLHFQPKVSLADGTLAGVEALVRWQHPRDGLVYPDAFIGVAEEHGLIDALTDEVLALALAQTRRWRDSSLAPRVAVNVSMDNLVRLDFPDRVRAQLAAHGLGPANLLLEVTESRLMRDPRAALDILTRLRLHGVALAIDDFGTGHSSLAQLRDLPFDELKIDRGFVRGCGALATRRAIVAASAEMAHQLGMRSVAEGVEDLADWEAVRAAGCDIAQGWFVAKPMPGELLPAWASGLARRFGAEASALEATQE